MAQLSLSQLRLRQRVEFIQESTGTVISLDASISESHNRESPPTEFQVESGQTVSDHVIVKPFSLEIQGIISDSPVRLTPKLAVTTFITNQLPPTGIIGVAGAAALMRAIEGSNSPSTVAYKQLLELQQNRMPFNVKTTLYFYKNMWIKSITVPRDVEKGNSLVFTVSLVELLLVQPVSVNIKKLANPDISATQANQGRQEMQNLALQAFRAAQADVDAIAGVR